MKQVCGFAVRTVRAQGIHMQISSDTFLFLSQLSRAKGGTKKLPLDPTQSKNKDTTNRQARAEGSGGEKCLLWSDVIFWEISSLISPCFFCRHVYFQTSQRRSSQSERNGDVILSPLLPTTSHASRSFLMKPLGLVWAYRLKWRSHPSISFFSQHWPHLHLVSDGLFFSPAVVHVASCSQENIDSGN